MSDAETARKAGGTGPFTAAVVVASVHHRNAYLAVGAEFFSQRSPRILSSRNGTTLSKKEGSP